MKKVLFGLVCMVFSASSFSQDGVIHFTGAIVSPACEVKKEDGVALVETTCYQNGSMIKSKSSLSAISLNRSVVISKVETIPGHSNLKILTLTYQ